MTKTERDRSHPPGLPFLFFTEFWERFGYFTMISLAVLYMTDVNGIGLDKSRAFQVFGTFIALVYTPLIGGALANTRLGYKRSIIIGCLLMAAGYLTMAIPGKFLFKYAVLLVILGTGFFKTNISGLVNGLYNDPLYRKKKDTGLAKYYRYLNLGALICPVVVACLRNSATENGFTTSLGWQLAFSAPGIGMILGLIIFLFGSRHYTEAEKERKAEAARMKNSDQGPTLKRVLLPVLMFGALGYFLPGIIRGDRSFTATFLGHHSTDTFVFACIPIVIFFLGLLFQVPRPEKRSISALLTIMVISVAFWAVFKQCGTILTIWAENYTDREVPSFIRPVIQPPGLVQEITLKEDSVPVTGTQFRTTAGDKQRVIKTQDHHLYLKNLPSDKWPAADKPVYVFNTELFQSLNPLFILLLSPLILMLVSWLRRKNREPSIGGKIALGMFFASLSALIMAGAVFGAGNGLSKASAWWLVGNFFLMTIGELFLTPMGLPLVQKLSPPRLALLMTGAWGLSASIGNKVSGILSSRWDSYVHKEQYFYLNFGILIAATLMLIIVYLRLRKSMTSDQ